MLNIQPNRTTPNCNARRTRNTSPCQWTLDLSRPSTLKESSPRSCRSVFWGVHNVQFKLFRWVEASKEPAKSKHAKWTLSVSCPLNLSTLHALLLEAAQTRKAQQNPRDVITIIKLHCLQTPIAQSCEAASTKMAEVTYGKKHWRT